MQGILKKCIIKRQNYTRMIASIYVNVFLSTKTEKAKTKILKNVTSIMQENSISYTIDNTSFILQMEYITWENLVYHLIEFCQLLGYQWVLTGTIEYTFDSWTNHPKIIGVDSIGISCDNQTYAMEEQ